ncbi:imidazolonepropionase-like amidohydrolase [Archangium gephyra]|uniref:Imidazolonepropionase-like amidohydrolase n=2 Tax=Archangium gephyra TaxID=48 RepID=A0ABX9JYY2_9BACT|nr:amidohydrolase family protein [Archangium gephyra]REG29763.1 imidazolonepropionase-like amidohydrolase [Archangium gephyra]
MRRETRRPRGMALGLALWMTGCGMAHPSVKAEAPAKDTVAFVDVNVVPMDSERLLAHQTVVVRGERIVALGPVDATPVPVGAARVEGRGRYLMPGLADMHLHLVPGTGQPEDPAGQVLALLLANGVTSARALGGPKDTSRLVRDRVARGEVLGPTLRVAAPSLHGKSVQGPEQARQRVREYKAAGYDLLKTHGSLGRETYDAMMSEARAQGLAVSGHVTPDVGLFHALESGQQIEHLDGYLNELLPENDSARQEVGQVEVGEPLERMEPARIPALAEATRKAGVWSSPTLALFETVTSPEGVESLRTRPELRYAKQASVEAWTQMLANDSQMTSAPAGRKHRFAELRRQVTRGLYTAGAKLLVGSDSPQLFMVAGFAVHREMEALAAAGIPPYGVLEAATRNAAEYLGEAGTWGTVAEGRRADLLLLEANPLEDVKHTRDIAGVMVRGQWLPRSELDAMLERTAVVANAPPRVNKGVATATSAAP